MLTMRRCLSLKPWAKWGATFRSCSNGFCQSSRNRLEMLTAHHIHALRGIIAHSAPRGKPVKITASDKSAACSLDRVSRHFKAPAPNMLWLSDFTYVATWQGPLKPLRGRGCLEGPDRTGYRP